MALGGLLRNSIVFTEGGYDDMIPQTATRDDLERERERDIYIYIHRHKFKNSTS